MFIAEKGLKVETREISMIKGEQLTAEFTAINPGATIPVLVTDSGLALTENLGIAAYLEALHPSPPLMGTTPDEKGEILMWSALAESQGGQPVAEALRNSNPHMKARAIPGPENFEQIPELAERGMRRITLYFDKLENHLNGRDFIAADHFTLADITNFVFVDFARVVKIRVDADRPNLLRWYEAIKARPSAKV